MISSTQEMRKIKQKHDQNCQVTANKILASMVLGLLLVISSWDYTTASQFYGNHLPLLVRPILINCNTGYSSPSLCTSRRFNSKSLQEATIHLTGGADDDSTGISLTSIKMNSSDIDSTINTTDHVPIFNQVPEQYQLTDITRGGDVPRVLRSTAKNHSQSVLRLSSTNKGDQPFISKRQQRRLARMEKRKSRMEAKSHLRYANKLQNRNSLNIGRKIYHACFGITFATLNQILPREIFLKITTGITTFALIVELLRYRKGFGWMNDTLHWFLGGSLRKHEMEGKFTGSFYYFLGVTLTSYLYPKSCASLGICQLALADPSASFFGRQTRHVYWSRIENGFFGIGRNKGLLGFAGGALFCFPFNYRVLSIAKYGGTSLIPGGYLNIAIASLALGVAGAFADLCVPTPALTMPKKILGIPVPRFHVDDNVVVPVFSGYACTKIFDMLGWNQGVDLAKFIWI